MGASWLSPMCGAFLFLFDFSFGGRYLDRESTLIKRGILMPDSAVTLFIGEKRKVSISRRPFIVRTRNSTYKLGWANKKGERSIKRLSTNEQHVRPLEFTRCRVTELIIGGQMQVIYLDGPENRRGWWHTSIVYSVERV